MKRIPRDVEKLYDFCSLKDKIYIKLRWKLCPFELIERFLPKSGRIVDVGCGYGLLANLTALRYAERDVYGFDMNARRINIARKSVKNRKNVHFEIKNVKDLRLGSCDAIIMSDFLHHVPYREQENLIKQAYGKLKKKGIMIILDIEKKPLWKYLFAANLDRVLNCFPRLYYRDVESFNNMLERNGFSVSIINADMKLPLPDVLLVCKKI